MSFFLRKAQVRPTISWPVESQRDKASCTAGSSTTPSSPTSYRSSRHSNRTTSTAATTNSLPNSLQCECDAESPELEDDIDTPDDFPDKDAIVEAGEVMIYDSEGNERAFKTLVSGETCIGEQQLVIFVRHFFCGVSLGVPLY